MLRKIKQFTLGSHQIMLFADFLELYYSLHTQAKCFETFQACHHNLSFSGHVSLQRISFFFSPGP